MKGKYMFLDLYIQNKTLDNLIEILDVFCTINKLNVVEKSSFTFDPVGITLVYILSESHLAVHTFPEKNLICIDLFTCSEFVEHSKLKEDLILFFQGTVKNYLSIDRSLD